MTCSVCPSFISLAPSMYPPIVYFHSEMGSLVELRHGASKTFRVDTLTFRGTCGRAVCSERRESAGKVVGYLG